MNSNWLSGVAEKICKSLTTNIWEGYSLCLQFILRNFHSVSARGNIFVPCKKLLRDVIEHNFSSVPPSPINRGKKKKGGKDTIITSNAIEGKKKKDLMKRH